MNRSKVHMLRLVLWGAVAPALALGAPATGSPVVAEDGITIADLGPPGAAFSDTADINDLGQVVGYYNTDTEPPKAYLWTAEDGWTDLGNLEGGEHGQRHQRLGPGGGVERSYWRRLQVRLPKGGGGDD